MSIIESGVIDSVIFSENYEDIILLITDHLDWSSTQDHLLLLQEKLNTYIKFFESGQLEEDFPDSKYKAIKIMVVGKYELNEKATAFFNSACEFLSNKVNIELLFSLDENSV